MRRLGSTLMLVICAAAWPQGGCSCDGPPNSGGDAGGGMDGGGPSDASDASSTGDTSAVADVPDGGPPDAPTCTHHLGGGFTQVAASTVDQGFGDGVSMALDENDDPMFAYLAVPASVTGNTVPGTCNGQTSPAGCDALYFTRWDPCAGAFTTPIVVDPTLNYYGSAHAGAQLISLAYDPSTRETGIAYVKTYPTDPNWADTYNAVLLATRQAGQSSFTLQQVSDNLQWGNTDVSGADTPSLAMGGGHLYITYAASFGAPDCPDNVCLRFAASTTGTPVTDAGTDGGAAPPHTFALSHVPYAAGPNGLVNPRLDATSIALDSMGRPGIAAYQEPGSGYNTTLVYWRSGMPSAISVTDTNDVQNDGVSLSLAFEGTSPRVAGLLTRVPSGTGSYTATYVASPDDGTTWNAAQPFIPSGGLGFTSSLATDGHGNEAFTSQFNGSTDTGCSGANPFVVRSSDHGATWSGCALGANNVATNVNLATAFGSARIAGKFVLGGAMDGNGAVLLGGGTGYSVVYYQDP